MTGEIPTRRDLLAAAASAGILGATGCLTTNPGDARPPDTPEHPRDPQTLADAHTRIREAVTDPAHRLIEHDTAIPDTRATDNWAREPANLELVGRAARLLPNGTTDVWTHDGFAYTGTFNTPCGTGTGFGEPSLVDDHHGPGIPVYDIHDPHEPAYLGSLPSVSGSRINDVKVAALHAGTILVHTNEACTAGGPGGFEVYNVADPTAPQHLASVRVDDANPVLRDAGVVDVGVHNVFPFTQEDRDFVAIQTHALFGSFQLFELTTPTDPRLVSAWGAEFLCDAPFCPDDPHAETDLETILDTVTGWMLGGFGQSRNRFLHDVTVNQAGTRAYLACWDAGLVLLDITDPAEPTVVSVALEPTAGDGEVNSHHAWPAPDGTAVVETEEDFAPFGLAFRVTDGPNEGGYDAVEGRFTTPIGDLPDQTMGGSTTYLGHACDPDTIPAAAGPGEIAVVLRGECRFDRQAENATAAGYNGLIVVNDTPEAALVEMTGDQRDIPGVFVGHATGLAVFDAETTDTLSVGDSGADVEARITPGQWGNIRVWDYTDETNPVLASEFDTQCSRNPDHPTCDERGTYSVHNTIVEADTAYFSWYADGVRVLDITDPHNPVETARFHQTDEAFEDQNGGTQDVWGVHKEPDQPWIYASDRNGGLYILTEPDTTPDDQPD